MYRESADGELPEVAQGGFDRRAGRRLSDVWEQAKGSQNLPQLSNLGPAMEDDSLLDAFLLKAEDPISLSVFVYCGGEFAGRFEGRLEGTTLSAMLPHQIRGQYFQACNQALLREQPVQFDGCYALSASTEVRFRSAVLPVVPALASDSRSFGYLLGTLNTARYPIVN